MRKMSPVRSRMPENFAKADSKLFDESDPRTAKRMFRFEDLQTMKFNFNEFRPSDLIDIDSGDSDHEILAKFKQVNRRKSSNRHEEDPVSPKFSQYKQNDDFY